jgi:hypothetical protein
MKITYLVLALLVFTFNTCEEKRAASIETAPVHVQSVNIPSRISLGNSIVFEVTCGAPTPCWEFKEFIITRNERVYDIQVVAQYDGRPCVQILGSFKTSSSVTPTERGTYTLRFWRSQAPSLDATVLVE